MKQTCMRHCLKSVSHGKQRKKIMTASERNCSRRVARSALTELQVAWEQKILHTESHPGEDFAWDRALELLGLQWGQNLGEGQLEGLGIIKTPVAARTTDQQQRLQDYFFKAAPSEYSDRLKELKISELIPKLETLAKLVPPITRAPAMMKSPARKRAYIFRATGEYLRQGDEVTSGHWLSFPP